MKKDLQSDIITAGLTSDRYECSPALYLSFFI
nr:MAG TPA: hypothetical protein [Caudoviricetes sp.]